MKNTITKIKIWMDGLNSRMKGQRERIKTIEKKKNLNRENGLKNKNE